jgi:diadenosine tetraphosphate (Ap4A) HIT family hydrolase
MAIIYESENFIVESHEAPEVDRLEGGHVKISPKIPKIDRTELSSKEAIELMRLTIVSGIAMKEGMRKRGIEIGRINYQDNGNWKPQLHVHLYGRAVGAVMQKYGDPIIPGHREEYHPLDAEDILNIRTEIECLLSSSEYSDGAWGMV